MFLPAQCCFIESKHSERLLTAILSFHMMWQMYTVVAVISSITSDFFHVCALGIDYCIATPQICDCKMQCSMFKAKMQNSHFSVSGTSMGSTRFFGLIHEVRPSIDAANQSVYEVSLRTASGEFLSHQHLLESTFASSWHGKVLPEAVMFFQRLGFSSGHGWLSASSGMV